MSVEIVVSPTNHRYHHGHARRPLINVIAPLDNFLDLDVQELPTHRAFAAIFLRRPAPVRVLRRGICRAASDDSLFVVPRHLRGGEELIECG
jgi:hypothetical protein